MTAALEHEGVDDVSVRYRSVDLPLHLYRIYIYLCVFTVRLMTVATEHEGVHDVSVRYRQVYLPINLYRIYIYLSIDMYIHRTADDCGDRARGRTRCRDIDKHIYLRIYTVSISIYLYIFTVRLMTVATEHEGVYDVSVATYFSIDLYLNI